ncbi:MAG TPA: glycosyltransferase [Lacibacter sp.]|nr:glycosyltransferase [Lacibacter sp.]
MSMEVSYFFRKPRVNAFSIEVLFENIQQKISNQSSFSTKRAEVPSIHNIAVNIWAAGSKQSVVNHITGDIHYVALGMRKRNTVLTIHDCVFLTKYSKWSLKYWLFKFFWYQLPMMCANTITVISEKTKRELVNLTGVDERKIKVVPNFFDPRFQFSPKVFNTENPRILQIGTKDNKNLQNLARALKGLRCELHIVGQLDAATKEVLETNRIHYKNFVNLSFEQLQRQYLECDMVAFVSTYEGFGLPILEACAVGRPLVTSRISPMDEIADDAACKVNPWNVMDIRRGITKVMEDAEYRDQLINNGWKMRYRYSIENISNQYADIYQQIAAQPAPLFSLLRPAKTAASFFGLV